MAQRMYDTNMLFGLVGPDYKYIHTTQPELFRWRTDPAEANNLVADEPNRARVMASHLEDVLTAAATMRIGAIQRDQDPETLAELESLGYAGAGPSSPVFSETKDDPKETAGLHAAWQRRVIDDIPSLERMVAQRPQAPRFVRALVKALKKEGRREEAVAHLDRFLASNPTQPDPYRDRARLHVVLGNYDQACEDFANAYTLLPPTSTHRARILDEWNRGKQKASPSSPAPPEGAD